MMLNFLYTATLILLYFTTEAAPATDVEQPTNTTDTVCPTIFYECPENSHIIPNTTCVTSFKNCACNAGYVKNLVKQVCDPVICPQIFYECPANSHRKPYSVCLTSFRNCACNEGYVKNVITQTCMAIRPLVQEFKNCSLTADISGCDNGYSCTYDSTKACITMVGADCPGICVPICAGELGLECPKRTKCVNNPAKPNCRIEADCPGVCLSLSMILSKSQVAPMPSSVNIKAPVVRSPIIVSPVAPVNMKVPVV